MTPSEMKMFDSIKKKFIEQGKSAYDELFLSENASLVSKEQKALIKKVFSKLFSYLKKRIEFFLETLEKYPEAHWQLEVFHGKKEVAMNDFNGGAIMQGLSAYVGNDKEIEEIAYWMMDYLIAAELNDIYYNLFYVMKKNPKLILETDFLNNPKAEKKGVKHMFKHQATSILNHVLLGKFEIQMRGQKTFGLQLSGSSNRGGATRGSKIGRGEFGV